MTDKQIDETLDPPVFRLKQMRRLLAEGNYYGNPIDDDFAALDAAIAALERQREQVYVVVERIGPVCEFLEIENAEGQGVSIPYAKTVGNLSWIGPLYRLAAAPEPSGD